MPSVNSRAKKQRSTVTSGPASTFLYPLPADEPQNNELLAAHFEQAESLFFQSMVLSVQTGKALELDADELATALEWSGVLLEGTAMGLALLDQITPWNRKRWATFVASTGAKHIFASYAALGMALAYLKQPALEHATRLELPWRWLVIDGYGFHHGFTKSRQKQAKITAPKELVGSYAEKAFYQGLGRSLWFVHKGNITQIVKTIAAYSRQYHSDLWSGLGIACAYIGGSEAKTLRKLGTTAGSFKSALCQGVTFAAMIRNHAGNPATHTELACQTLCRMGAAQAAAIAESTLADLKIESHETIYELWRQKIQAHFI